MIFASGLKYLGVGTTALGWILCATLLGAGVFWLAYLRPWKAGVGAATAGDLVEASERDAEGDNQEDAEGDAEKEDHRQPVLAGSEGVMLE